MTDNLDTPVRNSRQLLDNLLGNRRLTRRVIEVFPEEELFSFRIGDMRPFAEMIKELLQFGAPMVEGVASGDWGEYPQLELPAGKAELLEAWDSDTERIRAVWPQISADRFRAVEKAFGIFESSGHDSIQYMVENEMHHRAQGYVYLRALGIEPPAFYDRS